MLGLLGAAWMYYKRRNRLNEQDFSDSVFNLNNTQGPMLTADGGQAVDTFNSVFASSFSEMNVPDSAEVDPVAEADVYMQYGRDAHAEDILKDALKQNPDRLPVHLKLMELYASKNNQVALKERFAIISELTNSSGKDWVDAKKFLNQAADNTGLSTVTEMSAPKRPNIAAVLADSVPNDSVINLTGNSTLLKSNIPNISLSSPTQIADVPTTFGLDENSELKPIAKPNKLSEYPNPMQQDGALSLVTPVTKLSVLPVSAALDSADTTQGKLDNTLNFNIQKPTLFSPQTVIGVSSAKSNMGQSVDLSNPMTYQHIDLPTMNVASPAPVKLTDKVNTNTNTNINTNISNPASALDFKISKLDLETNSIFDKVSDVAMVGADNLSTMTPTTTQAIETKLSLAQAYIEIGDKEGAKELLNEIVESGHQTFSVQAKAMLAKV